MEERIRNIVCNLGDRPAPKQRTAARVVFNEDYEAYVLERLSRIHDRIRDPLLVMEELAALKTLFQLDVPLDCRPRLFRQLNLLLASLMEIYTHDEYVYMSCFSTMTAFKNRIDAEPQPDEQRGEAEFAELERLVYVLTDWEAHLDYLEAAFVTP